MGRVLPGTCDLDSLGMADLKPAYLIFGEDEGKIDPWRARVRARVQKEEAATLEVLRDDRLTGDTVAEAITALTLSTGRRWVLVDGIQRWKAADVKAVTAALTALPAETVVVFIAVGEVSKTLVKAVEECGGEVHEYKPPRGSYTSWARTHARELGIDLEKDAADALVARIPRDEKKKPVRLRQQTLLRELEKLALFAGEGTTVDLDTVELLTSSGDARMFELADAVIEGNRERALVLAEKLRAQGQDMMYILFALLRQIRNAHLAWALVDSGRSGDVQSELRVPQFVARKIVSQVKNLDGARFERALDLLADLDWSVRGGTDRDAESVLTLMLAGAAGGDAAPRAA
jgi:DNA polymerase-3 subunit delta